MAPTAAFLVDLLKEFPFQEGRLKDLTAQASDITHIPPEKWPLSLRAHLACMTALTCTALLPKGANKLGFAYNANTPRTGKTLCAQTSICPVFGWAAGRSWPVSGDRKKETNEEELRKVIDAAVIEGQPYIFFDNIKATVDSPALEAMMTLPIWTGRVMGTQKTFTAPINLIPILTGNDLKMSTDLMERFLHIDFFVEEAEASDRVIENVMETHWIIANRNAIFDAIFGLVEHWDKAGRPPPPARVRRGFETFGNIIGGVVAAAGFGDLFERRPDEAGSGNSTDNDMRRLVHLMLEEVRLTASNTAVPTKEFTFPEIVQICWQAGIFLYAIEGKEHTPLNATKAEIQLSESSRARFGAMLRKYAPEKIGRTWALQHNSRIRVQCTGADRTRRYLVKLHLTPRGRLHQILLRDGLTTENLNAYLATQDMGPIDNQPEGDVASVVSSWPQILPAIRALTFQPA